MRLRHLACAALLCCTSLSQAAMAKSQAGSEDARAAASLLTDLIRVDSSNPPGDTVAIANRLKAMFDALGVENEIIVAPNGKAAHFIARIKGDGSKKPILLAAHSDVVPAEPKNWKVEPFGGIEKDGYIWGRGALDNKGSVATFAIAVSKLVKNKVPLARDIIFLAEADEEQGTYHTSWLESQAWPKMDAEFALNEGGRVVWDAAKNVNEVKISYVDKLTISFKMTATGPNGHSARPWPVDVTANGQLIKAMARLADFAEPVVLTPATRTYFEGLAKTRPGAFADAVGELLAATTDAGRNDAAKKLIALDQDNSLGMEGLLRNTLVITMMQSGVKRNVIPATAEATMNARLFPGQSVDDFVAHIRQAIANPNIKLEIVSSPLPQDQAIAYYRGRAAVPPSSLDTELYAALVASAKKRWPKAVILPTILTGTTDAVPWREHHIPVYGIGPNPILEEQEAGVHGDDERVAVDALGKGVDYVYDVLLRVAAKKK
jgi:acetylornithine deacetylase/succinyl-diaminopimelate desuccinylase-like protein